MRYRVGLDVGTASLGVAAVSLDENNQPTDLIWKHVRIFDEPLEKSQAGLKSKKAGRRAARMQRRQIDRRKGRTKHIANLASLLGIHIEPSEDSGATLLEIRAKAAREKVSLSDLIRIFVKLGKRRGYGGVFRPKKEGAILGEVEGGSNDLKKAMGLIAESRGLASITLGEYLQERWKQGLPTKLKVKEKRDKEDELQNLYALRGQVEAEFEQIWQTQSAFHPELNAKHDGKPISEKFKHAIFYQRPLKAVGGMVGQCSLEPTLARAPRAQLAFQRFRIEKILADLRWGAGKRADKLTSAQRTVIRKLCDEKEVVKFDAIYKALAGAGCPKSDTKGLNLDRLSRDEIPGNKTNHVFNKLGLGEAWQALNEHTQIQVINFLADLGSPEQLDDPIWHTRFAKIDGTPRQLSEAFVAFINELKTLEKLDRLSKMGFEGGRASYSIKALKNITEWLDNPWWPEDWNDVDDGAKNVDEESAIRACYREQLKQQRNISLLDKLDAPPKTGNAVVDGSLRQIRYVMNRMIQELGAPPEQIVVEMAREMSVGVSKRNERESENLKNRRARLDAEEEIRKHGVTVTPSRVRRYLLYVEQGKGHCPYCDNKITLSSALDGAETEYEHILPKSLTQVGLKRSEVVLAHRSCNQEKGNRTPFQAFGHDANRWQIIQVRAKFFADKKAYRKAKLLLLEDFESEVLNDDSISGFADRQFHQTSWIAKEAAQWLQSVCKTPVSVSRGEMTAGLRRKWKLETVIPQVRVEEGLPILDEEGAVVTPQDFTKYRDVWEGHKVLDSHGKLDKLRHTDRKLDKRIDHRHHLIDAITIALTSRSLFAQMARQYKLDSERVGLSDKPRLRIGDALPLKNVRELALLAVRECPLSIKPDRYPDGAIFQETAYGKALRDGEGKERLTLRVKIVDLIDRKKGTTEQARKAIQTIVSDIIREIVSKAFEARVTSKTAVDALAEPIYQNLYGKQMQIKKVCCFTSIYADNVAIISHVDKNGREHSKRMINGGYSYLEAEIREGRLVGQPNLVKIQQAMMGKKLPKKEGIVRFYKGDTVLDVGDGKKYRIGMFKAAGGFFLVPMTEPRAYNSIEEPNSGKKSLAFSQVARLKLI
ncbi:type II CRISPR RNA-guided endonuclease Cas9 [Methylotenera sp.]|uniref:type II CRISPR RNA-guided endonuclease Cas9 n=1 Tax=Methylotenera sp. TaxID=2051956 RepID=UPI002732EB4A|nr:type II CRISPR RNA-guided endonuclease Cas9 [Methylotenera sp.]MDP3211937.1 type II CRISPR RNA-guided endonuclease Cas9 [Methylotenera sp.]